MQANPTFTPEETAAIWKGKRVYASCIHYGQSDHYLFTQSFATLLRDAGPAIESGQLVVYRDFLQPLDWRRAVGAHAAMEAENSFTHLFTFDSDMTVSLDHITRLLAHDAYIVSGTYFMRSYKRRYNEKGEFAPDEAFPCVAARDSSYITRSEIRKALDDDTLIPVTSVGCGSLLVSVEALRRIGHPVFKHNWEVNVASNMMEHEDGWFSRHATMAGIPMWMDPAVQPEHFAVLRVGIELKDAAASVIDTQSLY